MAARYILDPAQSRFTVQAFAGGMLSGFAHNPTFAVRKFSGALLFGPDTPGKSAFDLVVDVNSLELTDKVNDSDRNSIYNAMRNDALETTLFSQIEFHCDDIAFTRIANQWYRAMLNGNLTLHGVTNPQQIDSQLRFSDDQMHLGGQVEISQAAYNIKRVSAVAGMVKIRDDLKFAFEIAGHKEA